MLPSLEEIRKIALDLAASPDLQGPARNILQLLEKADAEITVLVKAEYFPPKQGDSQNGQNDRAEGLAG